MQNWGISVSLSFQTTQQILDSLTHSSSSGSESGEGEGVTGDGVSGEGGDGESDKMEGEGESPITKADESPSADNDGKYEREIDE